MNGNLAKSKKESSPVDWIQSMRGKDADRPLRIGIVGGGGACRDLLRILEANHLSGMDMKVLGVADINPQAPGLKHASRLKLFATTRFEDLYKLDGLNLLIELTGSERVRESILRTKPPGVSIIDHRGARFLWNLIRIEMEKTQLERDQHAEEEKEKKHKQVILDSLPYRVMVVNDDMTISTVNQTFLKDTGLTYEEVIGRSCYEVRYGLNRPCGECGRPCYMEEVKRTGNIISTIHECTSPEGEERYEVITVSPILDEAGNVIQSLEASRDVTDRIKLEKEAQRSNIFLQNVIQSTVDGIVVVDTKGYPLLFNEGMERLTGYTNQEIMERGHLSKFYDMDVARENMRKMRSDQHGPVGKLNPTSMSIRTKSGEEIPVTLTASIITINEKEVGSVGVFTDMREILQMRKDLEEAHLQLVQSEKIASVGKMAAGVAHEINNPLSGIMIYAELLKEALKREAKHMTDIQEIIDQTLRCKKIVADLLEFSRQSIGKPSHFSIAEIINKTLNLLINQAIFQNIEVKKDIQDAMPQMAGDMGQLQQVFTNLFINAADAMQGKGRLEITASFDAAKNQFVIGVADSGPGIPEGLTDKVFDMFFTTKPVGRGTGLGLSISQNIIQLHGGSITFACPPDGGTRFTIELPLGFVDEPHEEPVFIGLDAS